MPAASVIIAAYTMERWDDLCDAVSSVRRQTVPAETVVVIDHNPQLLTRAHAAFPDIVVIPNDHGRGASGARNTGVAASSGAVAAFLDDDAVASPTWLEALLIHFASPDVVGVGGRTDPLWMNAQPRWFPPEFGWAVGASYRGMPDRPAAVRNVWSGNMVIRRNVFDAVGGFRADFGKVGERPRPEDTDLCIRAASANGRGRWIYEPAGLVLHRVPAQRATISYFLRRCFNEGTGKAALAALNGARKSTATERHYSRHVLPAGLARSAREAAGGDVAGSLRATAIVTGFSLVAAGYAVGRTSRVFRPAGTRHVRRTPAVEPAPPVGDGEASRAHSG